MGTCSRKHRVGRCVRHICVDYISPLVNVMSLLGVADGLDSAGSDSLYVIDSALFAVCLDHVSPHTLAEQSRDFLHGTSRVEGGVQSGTCLNRWYDKSLQVCV